MKQVLASRALSFIYLEAKIFLGKTNAQKFMHKKQLKVRVYSIASIIAMCVMLSYL